MATVYKMTKWENHGRWQVADVSNLQAGSAAWWLPARVLDMELEEYVNFLQDKCGATIVSFTDYCNEEDKRLKDKCNSFLNFYFNSETKANNFIKKINKVARQKQFYI